MKTGRKSKCVLSMLLTLMMVVTLIPTTSFAADDPNITLKEGESTITTPSSNGILADDFYESEYIEPTFYTDVDYLAYYYDAVVWAVDNGITAGTSATLFSPDGICTRAQAATFLWRKYGCPPASATTMPFKDVSADSYYHDAVLWAVEKGIVKGTSDTTFSPDMNCSRAHIVSMMWRAEGAEPSTNFNHFSDVSDDAYYVDAVLWAADNLITEGTSATTFSPDDNCTRAQIVTFIYRNMHRTSPFTADHLAQIRGNWYCTGGSTGGTTDVSFYTAEEEGITAELHITDSGLGQYYFSSPYTTVDVPWFELEILEGDFYDGYEGENWYALSTDNQVRLAYEKDDDTIQLSFGNELLSFSRMATPQILLDELSKAGERDLMLVWIKPPEELRQFFGIWDELDDSSDEILITAVKDMTDLEIVTGEPIFDEMMGNKLDGWITDTILKTINLKQGESYYFTITTSETEGKSTRCLIMGQEKDTYDNMWAISDEYTENPFFISLPVI